MREEEIEYMKWYMEKETPSIPRDSAWQPEEDRPYEIIEDE